MIHLLLIRHGETDKNVIGAVHDYVDEAVLNNKGQMQLRRVAKAIKEYVPLELFCSREKRAVQSAQILGSILGSEISVINGVEERNWGEFAGKTWAEIQKVLDSLGMKERYEYKPPGGESWKSFEMRLINVVNTLVEDSKGKSVAIVTHGGAIRALLPYLLGVPKQESFKYDPDNASISVFGVAESKFVKVKINDTSHLVDD